MTQHSENALTIERLAPIDSDDACQRKELHSTLTSEPKEIPPKYLYDALGSELFEALTHLPEYYPSRSEAEILERHAGELMQMFKPAEVLEIGSGSSRKTRALLEAMADQGGDRYVPLDVSEDAVREAGEALLADYPWLSVHGVIADFHAPLGEIEREGARLIAFLGGTIGNLYPAERSSLLKEFRSMVEEGDALILGFDLIKERDVLEAAYDDEQGKTRAFIFNVLDVLNREFDADFDHGRFRYRARWDPENHWVEMQLVSEVDQTVKVEDLDLELAFEAGEHLRAEVSTKFTPDMVRSFLEQAGFRLEQVLTDSEGRYGLAVAVPAPASPVAQEAGRE